MRCFPRGVWAAVLLAAAAGAGCDSADPSPDDVSGRWSGELKADYRTVLGGEAVVVSNRYDVRLTLRQTGAGVVRGEGTLAHTSGGAEPFAFAADGRLDSPCDAGDCGGLDLVFQFSGPSPFGDFRVRFDVLDEGREIAGVPCCIEGMVGSVRLRR